MKVTNLFLLVIILLCKGSSCQLVFRDSPASATVLFNYPTTLRCSAYEPEPPTNIIWLKDGVISESDPRGRYTVSYDPTTGRSEYTIRTVSYSDDGNYQCFAVNDTNGILASSATGTLTVQGQPGFANPISSVTVPLGGTAVFECPVLSNPPATVSWSYENSAIGFPITSESRYTISPPTTLTITNVQMSDEGYYVCQATNNFGRNSTSGRLIIGTPPPELNLMVSPSSPDPLRLNQGDSLSLSCSVTQGALFSSIQWTRGSTPLTSVSQTANSLLFSIPSVRFEDGGVYTCTVVDSFGDSDSASIRVEVDVLPEFTTTPQDITVTENEAFNFNSTCTAVGEPDPTITWYRADATIIPLVDSVPLFGELTRDDAGVFACVAANSAGEIRHEFTVTVQGPPVFIEQPANTEASYGQDVVLQCRAVGPPEPSYSWTRLGSDLSKESITTSDSTMLHLFSVTTEDEGTYQCTAVNEFGMITGQGTLSVLARPQILEATFGPIYLEIGTSFSLQCSYSGPPSVVQIWTLNGVPLVPSQDPNLSIGSDGSLTVSNPQEQYSGEYVCNVTTSYSFDVARVTVVIGNPPQLTLSPSDMDLMPGSTGTLPCVSSGRPQPWSTWFKTDNFGTRSELPTVGSTFTKLTTGLELHDVVREDSGVYECMVDNGIGTVQQSAAVRVEGAPLASGVSPAEMFAGEVNVSLVCVADFNYPAGAVNWARADGVDLPAERFSVGTSGELVILTATVDDEAEYVCTITNSYGVSTTSGVVSVLVPPSIDFTSTQAIASVQSSFMITCPASGRPTPSIQWFLADGRNADTADGFSVDTTTGELTLFNPAVVHEGTLTCVATNRVGDARADIELLVRGPAVSTLLVNTLTPTVASVVWTPPSSGITLLSYQLEVGRVGGREDERMLLSFTATRTQAFVTGLLPGVMYEFVVRGLFEGGLRGLDLVEIVNTEETAPTGPPQNITVSPIAQGFRVTWTLPLESERNGVINSYRIFYRRTPLNATLDPPFSNVTYIRDNLTEVIHVLSVENLGELVSYDVKLLASTSVGDGPESPLHTVTTSRRPVFNVVDFPLVLNVVIGVSAGVLGSLLIAAVVMALCLVSILCWRRCTKFGKHKPLSEDEESQRRGGKKSVSAPIPGITPKFDDSVNGKFTVQGENGRILKLRPTVITEEDVASLPREGQPVKVVPHDEIFVSKRDADEYETPVDAMDNTWSNAPQSQQRKPTSRPVTRPESGIYSEVQDVRSSPGVTEQTDGGHPQEAHRGREAAEESETNLQSTDPDVIVVQPPSPERKGVEGEDTGRDDAKLIYASVSEDYKKKKREKMSKQDEKLEAKRAKEEKRMQEKMERERKKQEEKKRKQEEKERKKQAKDQQLRSSMGLDNVVHLHELDPTKGDSRAQAEFIDAATAALF